MQIKWFCIFSVWLLFFELAYSQQSVHVISGKITDSLLHPIAAASVSLTHYKDLKILATVLSDSSGEFSFTSLPDGEYQLIITSIAFRKYVSDSISLNASQQKVWRYVLLEIGAATYLDNVTVVKRKPLMEFNAGTVTMNVEALPTNAGSNVLELLEKMPGVTIDRNNQISLKGKQDVLVTVDGRQTYMTGESLSGLLRSMNANQVSQLEIINNPDAKYDAAGTAGIINIITKRIKKSGFNGDLNAGYGQGYFWKTFNSLNLNYRTSKFNWFLNYSLNADRTFFDNSNKQEISNPGQGTIANYLEQYSRYKNISNANNIKAGIDYFLSDKTTVGLTVSGVISRPTSDYVTNADLKNSQNEIDSILLTTNSTRIRWNNKIVTFSLVHHLDSLSQVSTDFSYVNYQSKTHQEVLNNAAGANGVVVETDQLQIGIPVSINVFAGKADYGLQIHKTLKFEAGIKSSYIKNNSLSEYSSPDSYDNYQIDYSLSNKFTYSENINAAYGKLNFTSGKWQIQGGLRFENTNGKGERSGNSVIKDSSFTRNYNDFFPSVLLNYKLSDNSSFNFSAGRRIDRPSYQSLDPFINYVSKYVFDKGNPFLRPQRSYNLDLSYSYKTVLFATFNYSKTSDFIFPVFSTIDRITVATPGNYGYLQSMGVNVSTQFDFATWWSVNYSVYIGRNSQSGVVNNKTESSSKLNGNLNATNSFRITAGWGIELSGFYNSSNQFGQFVIGSYSSMSAGFSKSLFKNKLSCKVNIRDIFYTNNFNADIAIDGGTGFQRVSQTFRRKTDSRVINISFSYRFGKSDAQPAGNKSRSSAEEEQRLSH